jgi:hypothetical protein
MMDTIPWTLELDRTVYRQVRECARLKGLSLEQVVQRLLRRWVESQTAHHDLYIVQPGDTLARIAARLYEDAKLYTVLAELNGIDASNLIRVGQVLRCPPLHDLPPPPPVPGIEFVQSPHCDQRPPGSQIWALVVHATANSTLAGLVSWFLKPESLVSAHYGIGKDGRIVQMARDEQRAWHAGESVWRDTPDVNDYSIGIELVNRNDGIDPYPDAQYRRLVSLCKALVNRYEIQIEDIVAHREISLSDKDDPVGLDLERLRQHVAVEA